MVRDRPASDYSFQVRFMHRGTPALGRPRGQRQIKAQKQLLCPLSPCLSQHAPHPLGPTWFSSGTVLERPPPWGATGAFLLLATMAQSLAPQEDQSSKEHVIYRHQGVAVESRGLQCCGPVHPGTLMPDSECRHLVSLVLLPQRSRLRRLGGLPRAILARQLMNPDARK